MSKIPYTRVIPRDLFNEAKILKCIGQLCLDIEDRKAPACITYTHEGEPFDIRLDDAGYLRVRNVYFAAGKEPLVFLTTHNSKRNYPLILWDYDTEVEVYDELGRFTRDFLNTINEISCTKQ